MTASLEAFVFTYFAIFCRIAACLMLVPGLSSARVPVQVRLLAALAISLALAPLLYDTVNAALAAAAPSHRLFYLVNEVAAGLVIGLMARIQLLALQFAATFTASAIGLAGIPGVPLDEGESTPPLTSMISAAGTIAVMAAGLHIEMLRALIESYGALPMRLGFDPAWHLDALTRTASQSSLLALRISGPVVVYGLVVNFAIGLAGKFTPQVQIYFASLGLVTAGGLVLLYFAIPQWFAAFTDSYGTWLASGGA